jgi:hypothetical protein
MDVDPAEFAALLDDLPPERFEAFVVDLWRARGWTVDPAEGYLRATDRFGADYVIHLQRVTAPRAGPGVTELLVTSDWTEAPPDVRVVGPPELRRLLRYAVDPERARTLFVRTFDRPPEGTKPGGWFDRGTAAAVLGLDRRRAAAVLVLAAGLSLAAMGVSLVGSEPGPAAPAPLAGPTDTATPAPTPTAGTPVAALPPGVARDGSVDAARLARAHREAISGRSYRLVVSYREFGGRASAGTGRERIVVESANVYATDVFRAGTLAYEPGILADVEAYAEGGVRYQRAVDGESPALGTRAIGDPAVAARYAERVQTLLSRYLAVDRTRIVTRFSRDGRTHYWLAFGDDGGPRATNVTGSAIVDDRGVVHSLRWSYEIPGTDGRAAVASIQYAQFGDVRAAPPAWYVAARNRTATRRAAVATPQRSRVAA